MTQISAAMAPMTIERIRTASEAETKSAAARFAARLRRGDVVTLFGEFGTGKTKFVQGICSTFGVHGRVTSPSFVLLNRYVGFDGQGKELPIFHFDLYRVRSRAEIMDLGYEEFFFGDAICVVEWSEQLHELLPARRWDVRIAHAGGDMRDIEIERIGETQ